MAMKVTGLPKTRFDLNWLLLALLCTFVVAPLSHPLYFWGAHDARHSVYFLVEFDRSVQEGILYPRWAPDFAFGFGYPIFNINAPLAYFVAEAGHLAGLGFVEAVKVTFGLGFVLSGMAMYLFARDAVGRGGGLLAAVIYVYMPYHLADVYVRGALAESFAFIFVPIVFWSVRRLLAVGPEVRGQGTGDRNWPLPPDPRSLARLRYAAVGGLALAALIMTHNAIAMFTAPLLAAYSLYLLAVRMMRVGNDRPRPIATPLDTACRSLVAAPFIGVVLRKGRSRSQGVEHEALSLLPAEVIRHRAWRYVIALRRAFWLQREAIAHLVLMVALAVAISAIFWLPMVGEYKFVRTDQWTTADYDYRDHFVYLNQFFSPFWGFGVSKPGPDDGMSFQLGVVPVTLALLGTVGGRRGGKGEYVFFGLTTLALVFLMQPTSSGVWTILGVAQLAQFPWRLLAMTVFSLAFLSGFALKAYGAPGLVYRVALVALVASTIWASYGYLSPQFIEPAEGPVSLAGLMRFQQSSGELVGLTMWNKVKPKESPLLPIYLAGQVPTDKVAPESLAAGAVAKTQRHSTVLDEVIVRSPSPTPLTVYTQYYPGWKAYVDGQPVPIDTVGDYGLMTVEVPAGEHTVLFRFETTAPRVLGAILTAVGLTIAFGLLVLSLRQRLIVRC